MVRRLKNTMLKLINIVKNENNIEADYIPEQGGTKGHVTLNSLTEEGEGDIIDSYGTMYLSMALSGLRRILSEINNKKIDDVPTEKMIVWY